MACSGKFTPFRIIGGRLLEEGGVYVASPNSENLFFPICIMRFRHLPLPFLDSL